jgi:spore coat protein U-like protein
LGVILPSFFDKDFDMNTKMSKLALAIGALVMAGGAMAATDTANLAVTATVVNNCAIGPGTLAFGSTLSRAVNSGLGTAGTTANVNADSGATVSIICTNGASATITGGLGLNAAAGTVRKMISGTDLLAYQLYTTAARTIALDTTTGSIPYTGTGSATTTTAIYGQILAADLNAAKKGSYSDTVALTLTYTP